MNWDKIEKELIKFLKIEVANSGLKKAIVGLSGGLDSAVVAILCKKAFGKNFKAIIMPSQFSSESSVTDAKELCNKFEIAYEIISITPMVESYIDNMNSSKLRAGNFSARMRMSVLYDISARDSALVIGTSNRSEILLGYGTIYGDTACAINPIGQMYKSDEFEFAKFLGVTEDIISKKPSADLWEGQSDEDDLGYTYDSIDNLLKEMIDKQKSVKTLLSMGFNQDMIDSISVRVEKNQFKSRMPKIAEISY
jgi:NAD+ synthase